MSALVAAMTEGAATAPPYLAFLRVGTRNMEPVYRRDDIATYRSDAPWFVYDGYYVIEQCGMLTIVQGQYMVGRRCVRVKQTLSRPETTDLPLEDFNDLCRGLIVGAFRVQDERLLKGTPHTEPGAAAGGDEEGAGAGLI